jgi:hypothetical protein
MRSLQQLDIQQRLVGTDVPPVIVTKVPRGIPALEALASPLQVAVLRLEEAQELWQSTHFGPAVVLAQGVAEVYFQTAVAALFAIRGISALGDAVSGAVRGISLSRTDHRTISEAISGDNLAQTAFWSEYEAGRRNRDAWVHGLEEVPESAAEAFLLAVIDLIAHVKSVLRANGVKDVTERYRISQKNDSGRLEITVVPLDSDESPISVLFDPVDRPEIDG